MEKQNKPKKTVSIRMSEDLCNWLQSEADANHSTVSRIAEWHLEKAKLSLQKKIKKGLKQLAAAADMPVIK